MTAIRFPSGASLARLFPLVAGVAAAYAIAGYLELQTPPPALQTGPRQAVVSQEQETSQDVIKKRNILNLETPKPPEKEVKKAPAPPPPGPDPKDWRIAGAVIGDKSVAFVTVDKSTEFVYPGQALHNWTLTELSHEGALWKQGNETRYVPLLGAGVDSPRPPKPAASFRPQPAPAPAVAGASEERRVTLERSLVADVLKDPSTVLKDALFKPYNQDGQVVGYMVRNIKRDSVLRKIGLRSGDVLMRINGVQVDTPKALLDAYSGLDQANSVSIETLRRGQPQSVFVTIN